MIPTWLLALPAFAQATVDPELAALTALRITGAPGRPTAREEDRALIRSLEALVDAAEAFERSRSARLASHPAPATEVALHVELAHAARHVADALRTAPPPFYLTAAQRELYAQALGDRAAPSDDEEVLHLEAAVRAGAGARLTCHPALLDAVERLSDLVPARWGAVRALPRLDPAACASSPAALALLRTGDASAALAILPESASVERAVALELVGEDAATVWSDLARSNRRAPAILVGAAASALRQGDHRAARSFADDAGERVTLGDPLADWLAEIEAELAPGHGPDTREADRLSRLRRATDALEPRIARCPDAGMREEATMVLEQARIVLRDRDVDLAPDMLTLVLAYADALAACE